VLSLVFFIFYCICIFFATIILWWIKMSTEAGTIVDVCLQWMWRSSVSATSRRHLSASLTESDPRFHGQFNHWHLFRCPVDSLFSHWRANRLKNTSRCHRPIMDWLTKKAADGKSWLNSGTQNNRGPKYLAGRTSRKHFRRRSWWIKLIKRRYDYLNRLFCDVMNIHHP